MRKTIGIFILIALASGAVRGGFGVLSHIFFWDEFWYVEVASRLLKGTYSMGHERIPGWSMLIAFFNFFFDSVNMMGIYLNIILGSITVAINFLLFRYLKAAVWVQVAHSILWIFSVKHIIWSRAGETNISSLFFLSLFWILVFEYWNKPTFSKSLWLGFLATLAMCMRIENGLLFVIMAFVLWTEREQMPLKKVVVGFIFPLVLIKPIIYSFQFYSSYSWTQMGPGGNAHMANYSIQNIVPNIFNHSRFIFEIFNSSVLWVMCIIGLVAAFYAYRKWAQAAVLFFTLYFLAYFSGWLTQMGPDKVFIVYLPLLFALGGYGISVLDHQLRTRWSEGRVSLVAQVLLSLLILLEFMPGERIYFIAVMIVYVGIEAIRKKADLKFPFIKYQRLLSPLIALLVCISFISDFGTLKDFEDDEKTLMTQLPRQLRVDIPNGSTVYTATTESINYIPEIKAENADLLLERKHNSRGDIYFLQDIACSKTKPWMHFGYKEACQKVLDTVPLAEVKTYRHKSASFTLYKVKDGKAF